MTLIRFTRRAAMVGAIAAASFGMPAHADGHQLVDSIHFLIPGGAGGGWDGTARGTGEALVEAGLIGSASYENMSGGGGGRGIGFLIENAASNHGTLMVNSTPIVIRSLTGVFPQSFRDLTLVAGTIGDFQVMIVSADSDIMNLDDMVAAISEDPNGFSVGGGSVPGGMDHLVAAMVYQGAGLDPVSMSYVPFDSGGSTMAGLLSGEVNAVSTGFSEVVELANAGEIRVIGVTSAERVDTLPDAPTFTEQGNDTVFVNWRGFFAAPGLPDDQLATYQQVLEQMYETEAWENVRSRNGWVNIHNSGDDFRTFLEAQEEVLGDLMRQLGFL